MRVSRFALLTCAAVLATAGCSHGSSTDEAVPSKTTASPAASVSAKPSSRRPVKWSPLEAQYYTEALMEDPLHLTEAQAKCIVKALQDEGWAASNFVEIHFDNDPAPTKAPATDDPAADEALILIQSSCTGVG